jgi:hypothetical protein
VTVGVTGKPVTLEKPGMGANVPPCVPAAAAVGTVTGAAAAGGIVTGKLEPGVPVPIVTVGVAAAGGIVTGKLEPGVPVPIVTVGVVAGVVTDPPPGAGCVFSLQTHAKWGAKFSVSQMK